MPGQYETTNLEWAEGRGLDENDRGMVDRKGMDVTEGCTMTMGIVQQRQTTWNNFE